mmetsp:Transcript_6114/g.14407  ORF Transcript_6114/g.14407 Transcript_6114/m.14407 type:complete len:226 (-) Transcript_6114:2-679(-)
MVAPRTGSPGSELTLTACETWFRNCTSCGAVIPAGKFPTYNSRIALVSAAKARGLIVLETPARARPPCRAAATPPMPMGFPVSIASRWYSSSLGGLSKRQRRYWKEGLRCRSSTLGGFSSFFSFFSFFSLSFSRDLLFLLSRSFSSRLRSRDRLRFLSLSFSLPSFSLSRLRSRSFSFSLDRERPMEKPAAAGGERCKTRPSSPRRAAPTGPLVPAQMPCQVAGP